MKIIKRKEYKLEHRLYGFDLIKRKGGAIKKESLVSGKLIKVIRIMRDER